MGFGGGLYTEQNKTVPGAYFKFQSQGSAIGTYATRGLVGLICPSDWSDGELLRLVIPELEFENRGAMVWPRDAEKAIGYDAYAAVPTAYTGETDLPAFLPIFVREVFRNATGCFVYPLMGSTKAKASCSLATAAKYGTRGNALSLKVVENGSDDDTTYTVITMLDGVVMDEQTVSEYAELVSNAWVDFDKSTTLSAQASVSFTGGVNGTVDKTAVPTAIETLGNYGVNVLVNMVAMTDSSAYDALIRQNEKLGHWMQMVDSPKASWLPTGGSEYVIGPDAGATNSTVHLSLVYPWIAGAEASCALGKSLDNRTYDGELISLLVNTEGLVPPTQDEIEYGIRAGYMMLHTVGSEWRIMNDDNTFIDYTDTKDESFHRNQTIRVLHYAANDWHAIFVNEFVGEAGTDEADRTNYKMRCVASAKELQKAKAIKNFDSADITVSAGEQSDSYFVQSYLQPNFNVRKCYHEMTVAPFNS